MKSTSQCSLVNDKTKKWLVKSLLGPLAWLHGKFGPPSYSHLIILSRPNFFLSCYNNDPFLLPSLFSLLQIVIELEIMWTVCSPDHFLLWPWLQLYARYSLFIQAKHWVERVSVCARLACRQTYVFYFAKVIQPRGKVLHNRPRKMYDTITSARQLALNLAAFLCGL